MSESAGDGADGLHLSEALEQARKQAESGDLTRARAALEGALAQGELRLGRDHPRLVPLMVDLATIAREVGNLTEAQRQFRRAHEIMQAASGPEHPTTLAVAGRLAAVTQRLGEPTDELDRQLVDVGSRVLGNDHTAVRNARVRLAARQGAATTAPTPPPPLRPVQQYSAPARPAATEPVGYVPAARTPGLYNREPDGSGIYVVPAPAAEPEVPLWTELPPAAPRRPHRSGLAIVALVGAVALAAGGVVAATMFWPKSAQTADPPASPSVTDSTPQPAAATPTPSPTVPALPPTGVALTDRGASITITWVDPASGLVPFVVIGGRSDDTPRPMDSVPAGQHSSTIFGLNSRFDYCFTVTAVYSTKIVASSARLCTHRISTGNTPKVSPSG